MKSQAAGAFNNVCLSKDGHQSPSCKGKQAGFVLCLNFYMESFVHSRDGSATLAILIGLSHLGVLDQRVVQFR